MVCDDPRVVGATANGDDASLVGISRRCGSGDARLHRAQREVFHRFLPRRRREAAKCRVRILSGQKKQVLVNLVYCDDSRDGGDLAVIGAVAFHENMFHTVEKYLAVIRQHLVPSNFRQEPFEFKSSALFNGRPPFDGLGRDIALEIFRAATVVLRRIDITPIFYGAVNLRELKLGPFATAEPLDVAFRGCLDGLQKWVAEKSDTTGELTLLVCDDTTNQNLKKQLRQSLHYSSPFAGEGRHGVSVRHD